MFKLKNNKLLSKATFLQIAFTLLTCLVMSNYALSKTALEAYQLKNISQQKAAFLINTDSILIPVINQQRWLLDKLTIDALLTTKLNNHLIVNNFPFDAIQADNGTLTTIKLTRYQLFSQTSKIHLLASTGHKLLPIPKHMAYASSKHGISLLINPSSGEAKGIYNHLGASLEIIGNIHTGLNLVLPQDNVMDNKILKQCAMKMSDQPKESVKELMSSMSSRKLEIQSINGTTMYQTIVAVDTDNEWMAGKGNNTTTAMNYISSLFVNMNVYFERDLSTRLLIGDVFLRTTTDPFPSQPDIFAQLNSFGEYWRTNQNAIDRDFAFILSGQNIGSNSFSGIAWLNQYCQDGFQQGGGQTVGSYSINRIGTNISTAFVSPFVAHELGHNFGSPHTHCYMPAVDNCYNAEAGCFSGTPACPGGNGHGTIMSYCHFGGSNGANCGSSNKLFHPTVISLIQSRIINNSPSCIAPIENSDLIFTNGFE